MEMILPINGTGLPAYRALANAIKMQILTGQLKPGAAIPSVRELASSMGTSRSTILRAYELLASQGYVKTFPKSGTRVSLSAPQLENAVLMTTTKQRDSRDELIVDCLASATPRATGTAPSSIHQSNRYSSSHFFPFGQWRRCISHASLRLPDFFTDADAFGYPPLRDALKHYLRRSRDIVCDSSNVVVFDGIEQALDVVCRLTLSPGDSVVVQEPTFPWVRQLFVEHGVVVHIIPSNADGLNISLLDEIESPRMIYLCPSHQPATGTITSLARRKEILNWAKRSATIVFEDDSDNEYRYGRAPIQSMHGLNSTDLTIYCSTFERTLGPVVNLAYLVLPEFLVERLFNFKKSLQPISTTLDQVALEEFISSGNFEHHIHKTRVRYGKLRQALISKLKSEFGNEIEIAAAFSGMSLSLRFAGDWSSANICAAAEISNLSLVSARSYYQLWSGEHDYILSFTRIDEPEWSKQIALFVQTLKGFLSAQTSFATDTEDAGSLFTNVGSMFSNAGSMFSNATSACIDGPEGADVTKIGARGAWQQLPDCNQH